MDSRDVQAANELLAALHTLGVSSEKAELRAAGVPAHTIENLFPPTFLDLVPGLIDYLDEEDLRHLDGTDEWSTRDDSTMSMIRDTYGDFGQKRVDEYVAYMENPASDELYDHILDRLPGRLKASRTSAMLRSLWHAHWFMLNAKESGMAERCLTNFSAVIDWLLPDLLRRVNARDVAQHDVAPRP